MNNRKINILQIEDNPGDVRLTQEALKEGKMCNTLHVVQDGIEALDFLSRRGKYSKVARPHLILLDLNLPKKDGREVLAEIKKDPLLRRIPIVILSTSKAEEDIIKTYDLHANCYITKPVDVQQFFNVVKFIEDFWLSIVRLPSE